MFLLKSFPRRDKLHSFFLKLSKFDTGESLGLTQFYEGYRLFREVLFDAFFSKNTYVTYIALCVHIGVSYTNDNGRDCCRLNEGKHAHFFCVNLQFFKEISLVCFSF